MFTRRHYTRMAAMLAVSHHSCLTIDAQVGVDNTVEVFADQIAADHPTFKREVFAAAYARFKSDLVNGNRSSVYLIAAGGR